MARETKAQKIARLALEAQQQQSTAESAEYTATLESFEDMINPAIDEKVELTIQSIVKSMTKQQNTINLKAHWGLYYEVVRFVTADNNVLFRLTRMDFITPGKSFDYAKRVKTELLIFDESVTPYIQNGKTDTYSVMPESMKAESDKESVKRAKLFMNLLANKTIQFGNESQESVQFATNLLGDEIMLQKMIAKNPSLANLIVDECVKAWMYHAGILRTAKQTRREIVLANAKKRSEKINGKA